MSPSIGRVIMNTNCNTWGCLGCRDRLMRLFKMRVETGISTIAPSSFITITYKAESPRLLRAGCVQRDWRTLLNRLKRWEPLLASWSWIRVMELTKAGTPHHHLIAGPIQGKVNCWGTNEEFKIRQYEKRFDSCDCLAHRIAWQWYEVTGDSYVVHANWVTDAKKGANYLGKYLGKEFDVPRAAALGMARRWSTSRNFVGKGRLRLLQTERGWDRVSFADGHVSEELLGGPDHLTVRNGNDLTERFQERTSRTRLDGIMRRFTDYGAISTKDES